MSPTEGPAGQETNSCLHAAIERPMQFAVGSTNPLVAVDEPGAVVLRLGLMSAIRLPVILPSSSLYFLALRGPWTLAGMIDG